ncbi:MAG TPA: hypothetical protein VFO70_05020 [Chitinophagaceae bacterium]|nr:hypothetical protein [Chitinophagaceae bacterium]
MHKIYLLLLTIILFSCTRVRYIGRNFPVTEEIAVFINEQSVPGSYDYIGKGYVQHIGPFNPEKIQKLAIKKAREKGANAIIITDLYLFQPAVMAVGAGLVPDSSGKTSLTATKTILQPASSTEFQILFLKYNR